MLKTINGCSKRFLSVNGRIIYLDSSSTPRGTHNFPATIKMKKEPQHYHILVIKSCLKSPESSPSLRYEAETEHSSWTHQRGDDDCLVVGETIQDDLATMAVTTKKKVRFANVARCKATLALKHITKQEFRDTWYSRKELRAMYRAREVACSEDEDTDVMYHQSKPPSFSYSRRTNAPAAVWPLATSRDNNATSPRCVRVARTSPPPANQLARTMVV